MKRKAWVVASSLGVLGMASAPLACFSSSSASPPPEGTDSDATSTGDSGPPGDDATTLTSDGGPRPVEAGAADAGMDATVADASPGALTLTVLRGAVPEPGVDIVFQDDTGAVVTTATTDTSGTVSQFVMAGSQVTALLGTSQYPNLVTIQGVAPGDTLTVLDTPPATTNPGETLAVTLPSATWDASGIVEGVYAASCDNPVPYLISLASYCESAGQFPLLARAFDGSTGQEIAYTYQLGNEVDPEGGLPDGATSLPVTVTRPWAASTATATLTSSNPPGVPYDGGVTSTAADVSLAYKEFVEGLPASAPSESDSIDGAGTQVAQFAMHPGYPDYVEGQAFETYSTSSGVLVVGAATRASPQATSLAMSFDLSTLPLITGTSIDTTGDAGTTSQPNITWTSTGSLSAANGIFVTAQWNAATATDAGTAYTSGSWTILAPPTATSVRAPALPAALAAWNPPATATYGNIPRVGAIKASYVPGYAGLRAVFGAQSILSGYEVVLPALPANGTVYLVGIYQDEG